MIQVMFNESFKNNRMNYGKRVLVVNSNQNLTEVLGILRGQRHNIAFLQEYMTTAEVPAVMESNEIDLVIVDTTVNQKKGNVADRIKTRYPMRPVITICIENEKYNKSEIKVPARKHNSIVKKNAAEILQALDYADSLLRCHISGFIISLSI